jgi:glycosyltransferase involved in cell wall biosynthesis
VAEVLEQTSALLLPSRWPEPFGIVGLEAFAHGRPVIASQVGGIPEWLDANAGALVPPADPAALAAAIAAVLPRAAELGRAGWERVARYSVESHLAALDAVYEAAA